jgi:hypothetical protein
MTKKQEMKCWYRLALIVIEKNGGCTNADIRRVGFTDEENLKNSGGVGGFCRKLCPFYCSGLAKLAKENAELFVRKTKMEAIDSLLTKDCNN